MLFQFLRREQNKIQVIIDQYLGNQSTRHTVNSSRRKIVWRVDRRVSRCCDELTVLFDLAFIPFKSFAVVGDFDIARLL